MAMTRARDSVAAVEIEILVAVARVNPDTLATLRGDGHLFVRGELILIFVRHGLVTTSFRPVVSSRPNIKFIFCTAWPAAPFTRLSIAEKTTICLPRAANPMSQKLVVFTQLMSGEPFTMRTKNESR